MHESLDSVKENLKHLVLKLICKNTIEKLQRGSNHLFDLADEFAGMKRHDSCMKAAPDHGTTSKAVDSTVPSESIIELLLGCQAESHGFETIGTYDLAACTTDVSPSLTGPNATPADYDSIYRQDIECYQQAYLREAIKGVKDFEALGVHDGVCVPRCSKCLCGFHPPHPRNLKHGDEETREK